MKRGDVYLAELKPRSGSEQRGRRPVVVVSHDSFNTVPSWRSVMVVPFSTSGSQARRGPTAVGVKHGSGGLAQDSIALCHQVTTLGRSKLTQYLGTLSPDVVDSIADGIRAALDLT